MRGSRGEAALDCARLAVLCRGASFVVASLTASLLFCTTTRAGAAGWSTPRAATHDRDWAYAVRSDGSGVEVTSTTARTVSARGVLGAPVSIRSAFGGQPSGPVASLNEAGRVGLAWWARTLAGPDGPGVDGGVVAATGSLSRLPHTSTTLSSGGAATSLDAATTADGSVTVAWGEYAAPGVIGAVSLKVAVLRTGTPVTVRTIATLPAPGAGGGAHVMLDAAGRAMVAWVLPDAGRETATVVWAASAKGRPSAFGAPRTSPIPYQDGFAPTGEQFASQQAAVKLGAFGDGRLLVVWTTSPKRCHATGEDEVCNFGSDPAVYAAETTSVSSALSAPRRLINLPGSTAAGPAVMSVNAAGRALVALAANGQVLTINRSRGGAWGQTRTVGRPERQISAPVAAVDRSGRSLMIWADANPRPDSRGDFSYRILSAASRPGRPPMTYSEIAPAKNDPACRYGDVTLAAAPSGRAFGLWCDGDRISTYSPPAS